MPYDGLPNMPGAQPAAMRSVSRTYRLIRSVISSGNLAQRFPLRGYVCLYPRWLRSGPGCAYGAKLDLVMLPTRRIDKRPGAANQGQ